MRQRKLDVKWCASIAERWNSAPWPSTHDLAIEYNVDAKSVYRWLCKAEVLGFPVLSPGEHLAYMRAARKYALHHSEVV